ncbi:MAG: hypothetical protein WBA31_03660 [Candidatus Dormiibacterota bacterium]
MPRFATSPVDYAKSQAVLTLPHIPPAAAAALVASLLGSERHGEREQIATALLEVLNDSFGLPPVRLVLADRPQTHGTDQSGRLAHKTYGYYRCRIARPGAAPERCAIRIYHRTAIRQQVLASGAFVNTLLHEWTHHFDFSGLGLGHSPHTAGFFARLRWLAGAVGAARVLSPEAQLLQGKRRGSI